MAEGAGTSKSFKETFCFTIWEYQRIFCFSIGPAVVFCGLGLLFPLGSLPPFNNPLVFLGLLAILSCFVLDEEGPDGFFVPPPHGGRDKGLRLMAIKVLELAADGLANSIAGEHGVGRREPVHLSPGMNFFYVFSLSVMSVSFIRAVNIFGPSVVTLVRTGGRWTAWAPFDRPP